MVHEDAAISFHTIVCLRERGMQSSRSAFARVCTCKTEKDVGLLRAINIRSAHRNLTAPQGPKGRYNPGRCRLGTGFWLAIRRRRVGWYPMRIGLAEPQPQGRHSEGPVVNAKDRVLRLRIVCGSMNGVLIGGHPTRRCARAQTAPVPVGTGQGYTGPMGLRNWLVR